MERDIIGDFNDIIFNQSLIDAMQWIMCLRVKGVAHLIPDELAIRQNSNYNLFFLMAFNMVL